MKQHPLTFDKLGIAKPDWDIEYTDSNCGYSFSTPFEGVLMLKTVGIISKNIVDKQLQFINNYVIQLNKTIINQQTILIWDITELFNLQSYIKINNQIDQICTDLTFVVAGNAVFLYYLKLMRLLGKNNVHSFFDYPNEAVNFANKIREQQQQKRQIFSGKFLEIWSHNQKSFRINRHKYRVLKLPEWQYMNKQSKATIETFCYEPGIIHLKVTGQINEEDIHNMQQIILHIGQTLEVDFKRKPAYILLDLKKVERISPKGRKLLRKIETYYQDIAESIIVTGNPLIRYLYFMRSALQESKYIKWHYAKNTTHAFRIFEYEKTGGIHTESKIKKTEKPAKDYHKLRKQYIELTHTHHKLWKNHLQTTRNIRKILSYVNAVDFFKAPFKVKITDYTIEAELYNTMALLQKELKHKTLPEKDHHANMMFSQVNIQKFIDSISDPTLIYQDKKIIYINQFLADLLGYSAYELEQQPLSILINPFEINRVERFLQEANNHSGIACDIRDAMGNLRNLILVNEFVIIDGLPASIVFFQSVNTGKTIINQNAPAQNESHKQNINDYFNKAYAGIIHLQHAMLNYYDEQQFATNSKAYNKQENIQSLKWLSFFLKNSFQQFILTKTPTDNFATLFPGETIQNIFNLFRDYLELSKPGMQISMQYPQTTQKLKLTLNTFFIHAIIIRILHIMTDHSNANYIEFGCADRPNNMLEFFFLDNSHEMSFLYSEYQTIQTPQGLSVFEIKQLIKMSEGNFYIEQPEEGKNRISFILPVYERGSGYEGAMMDLSNHYILALDSVNEIEIIRSILADTGVQILSAQNIFEAQRIAKNKQISLLLINFNKTEIDTKEVISRIRAIRPRLPVIGITNDISHEKWRTNNKSGADAFITKPLESNELKSLIKLQLNRNEA